MTPTARVLSPYYCEETNPRTGRPCHRLLVLGWSAAGAVVSRKCKQCGTWATIEIEGEHRDDDVVLPSKPGRGERDEGRGASSLPLAPHP